LAFQIPSFETLGFETNTFFDPDQNKVTVISDSKTGWKLKIIYPFLKNLLSYHRSQITEIYNSKGGLIEKTESDPSAFIKETHWPESAKVEIRPARKGQYYQTVYSWNTKLEKWKFVSVNLVSKAIFENGCAPPIAFEELDQKLASVMPLVQFDDPVLVSTSTYFNGTNIRVTGTCEKYGPEGVKGLAKELELAIDRGVRCLADLEILKPTPDSFYKFSPNPELVSFWRMTAAQLLGVLDAKNEIPFSVICDKLNEIEDESDMLFFTKNNNDVNAQALVCGIEPLGPGMALHLYKMNSKSRADRLALLFHEVLHNAGILHILPDNGTYDAVYGAQFCCFGTNTVTLTEPERDHYSCSRLVTKTHGISKW
jgi:hypothetical protein